MFVEWYAISLLAVLLVSMGLWLVKMHRDMARVLTKVADIQRVFLEEARLELELMEKAAHPLMTAKPEGPEVVTLKLGGLFIKESENDGATTEKAEDQNTL